MKAGRFFLVAAGALLALLVCASTYAQFDTPNRSFHNSTRFRLEGRHLTVACAQCHIKDQYIGTPNTCYECHWIRRKDDRFQTRLGTQCETCHRPTSWTAVRWDHAGMTGVNLNADHRRLACESCHKGADVRAGAVTCVACHRKDYDASKSPAHAAAGFPVTCDTCHRPSDSVWQNRGGGGFNHAAMFHAGRRARDADVRDVSQEQRLQRHAARLRRAVTGPTTPGRRPPTTLRPASRPRATRVIGRPTPSGRGPRSTTTSSSRCGACTRRRRARRATRTTSTKARRAIAWAATSRITRGPQNPNHVTAGFPTIVRHVSSGDRPAVEGRELQPQPVSSRCRACTRRRRARRATRTTSTKARRATASAAISRTTRGPRVRTT